MAHRKVNRAGLDLIKTSESFVPHVYDDFVVIKGKYPKWAPGRSIKGTLTIGYGHTDAARYRVGVPLSQYTGPDWTETKASQVLAEDLYECEEDVSRIVKVKLNDNQFAALVSFTYNCGAGNLKKLVSRLNAGDYNDIPQRLMLYTKSKGKELRGLVIRRRAEAALWRSMPAEAIKNAESTKKLPTPEKVDEPASSTSEWAPTVTGGGAGIQALASTTSAVKEVKENTGELGIFDMLNNLITRPAFWFAIAALLFVMWWSRWPSWFWRRLYSPPPVAK